MTREEGLPPKQSAFSIGHTGRRPTAPTTKGRRDGPGAVGRTHEGCRCAAQDPSVCWRLPRVVMGRDGMECGHGHIRSLWTRPAALLERGAATELTGALIANAFGWCHRCGLPWTPSATALRSRPLPTPPKSGNVLRLKISGFQTAGTTTTTCPTTVMLYRHCYYKRGGECEMVWLVVVR